MTRITCTACAPAPRADAQHCHECKGLGYLEQSICHAFAPGCPVEFEAMTGGWECGRCGESGPLPGGGWARIVELTR